MEQGTRGSVRIGEIGVEQTSQGVALLSVRGEHDLNTAPELKSRLGEAGGGPVVVDLSPATFVDSSILGVILEARRHAQQADVGFAVCHDGRTDAVARVLEITGLRRELPVHATRDEALTAAADGSAKKAT